MRNHTAARRYRARPELRTRITESGRRADWLAAQVGISQSLLSNVLSNRRTMSEMHARVLSGLLGGGFDALFELSSGNSSDTDEQPVEAVA